VDRSVRSDCDTDLGVRGRHPALGFGDVGSALAQARGHAGGLPMSTAAACSSLARVTPMAICCDCAPRSCVCAVITSALATTSTLSCCCVIRSGRLKASTAWSSSRRCWSATRSWMWSLASVACADSRAAASAASLASAFATLLSRRLIPLPRLHHSILPSEELCFEGSTISVIFRRRPRERRR
jgi:hypothetical protein